MEENNNEQLNKPLAVEVVPKDTELLQDITTRELLYTVKDKNFGEFDVYFSGGMGAKPWWAERGKVDNLILSFKSGCNIKEACAYTGISIDQYKYFVMLHPNFSTVLQACKRIARGMILKTAFKAAQENGKLAMMWLDKVGFFEEGRIEEGIDSPKVGQPPIQTNIQINNGIQTGEIKEIIATVAREAELILARERGGSTQGNNGTVETENKG